MEELSFARCLAILESEAVGHVAVLDADGPYVSPVSYVVFDGTIYFRTGPGRRLRAITKDPRVCFEVSAYGPEGGIWESVVGFGSARLIDEDQVAQRVIHELFSKYSAILGSPLTRGSAKPLPEPGIVVGITFNEMTGRTSGSWFSIPTRPGRL